MKNNIIRVQKNKENPYIMLNKHCVNNPNVSWAAKGLHSYIMGLPDDWVIYVSELTKHTSVGREHTYTVIRELITNGYVQRFEYRHKGRVVKSEYVVYETPIEVDLDSLTKNMATIIKVNDKGEIIENTPNEPIPNNTNTDDMDKAGTELLINNSTEQELVLKNDFDVDDAEKTHVDKVIDLYKSFKIEKRVIPQTTKLLKQYVKYFTLEVFEYMFTQTSEESVKKKYSYLKALLEELYDNKVFTMQDLEKYNKKHKEKSRARYSRKTRFHNFNQTFTKYSESELEQVCKESQIRKANENKTNQNNKKDIILDAEILYKIAIKSGIERLDKEQQEMAKMYATENNIFIPGSWKCDK